MARGYQYHSLSDAVREATRDRGLETTRENLIQVGNELRAAGGPGALVDRLESRLKPPAIVDSVRNPGEVEALRRLDGFFLLGVDAPAEMRFARITSRGRQGDIRTAAEFAAYEAQENSSDSRRQRIGATLELSDAVVLNNGSLEDLHHRVRSALESFSQAR
jgi:dephospho-CoA kinase